MPPFGCSTKPFVCTFYITGHHSAQITVTETVHCGHSNEARAIIQAKYGGDKNFRWMGAIEQHVEAPRQSTPSPSRGCVVDPNEGFFINMLNGFFEGSGVQGPPIRTKFRDYEDYQAYAASLGITVPDQYEYYDDTPASTKPDYMFHSVYEMTEVDEPESPGFWRTLWNAVLFCVGIVIGLIMLGVAIVFLEAIL